MGIYKKAYEQVYGAAVEANQKYGAKVKHPVTGEDVYEQQIRRGKTKKNRK